MSRLYVAPTEPAELRELANVVSMLPEQYGCDMLILGDHHTVGVQRKAVPDLIASLSDGRLSEQSVLMQGLDAAPLLIVEGQMHWTNEDMLVISSWGEEMSKRRFRRVLCTLRYAGWHVEYSSNLNDTANWLQVLSEWSDVEEHSTLRPVAHRVRGEWGEQKRRHYQLQMLMGLPGVGQGLAERILDTVGMPLRLVGELQGVRGIGKKKYDKIKEIFDD